MPKIGQLISKMQVGNKVFKNPEVWNSAHKMKKAAKKAKYMASIKANSLLNSSYRIEESGIQNYDTYIKTLTAKLDEPRFVEYAPWNPVFKKTKQIILFKK